MGIFRQWLLNEANQVSRKDFANIMRWFQTLGMNLGFGIARADMASGTTFKGDLARLRRIGQWGHSQVKEVFDEFATKNLVVDIESGKFDAIMIPTLGKIIKVVKSLRHNFDDIGYDPKEISTFIELEKLIQPYESFVPWRN